eukprot:15054790-Alexandrium_andersonii.AAC.1
MLSISSFGRDLEDIWRQGAMGSPAAGEGQALPCAVPASSDAAHADNGSPPIVFDPFRAAGEENAQA